MPDQITLTCTREQADAIRYLVDMREMSTSHNAARKDKGDDYRAYWQNRNVESPAPVGRTSS